ncbi:hypothetical protein PISMIDRAFT_109548 [Pisolithus microcarpus 441]|uniref:Helitron helicase-like domain-containing protein n=1 Tax=Pisolithus microcarpus 441 TaxID=765257 RepID=A0A0C9ZEP1_9AGAM|nr:hypothetical protein PISMIDRAFT_109548 [Pisolithus microcarpus 441]
MSRKERHQKKRTYEEEQDRDTAVKIPRLDEQTSSQIPRSSASFLEAPSTDDLHACYRSFHAATGNEALAFATCGVCARECNVQEDGLHRIKVADIPNQHRLRPQQPHDQHVLIDGMLLEHAAIVTEELQQTVMVCRHCTDELRHVSDKPPKYSLANGLWIGDQPWVLQQLTFPEQLLIAHLYPRVYVFKLFPKRTSGTRDISSLQNAMRGNVTTFDQNMSAIANMVEGHLMPQRPTILASLITITFVGVSRLPKNWIRTTFRVQRDAVRDALLWLKTNNPKYYGGIEISDERLRSLPVDDVPIEITSVIRQSDDIGIIEQESEGYVPLDDDEGECGGHGNISQLKLYNCSSIWRPADIVPLQVSGTIDTEMSTVTANEMMSWGLSNLWSEGKEPPYAVRHSGQPVSDFGRPWKANNVSSGEETGKETNFFEKAYPCLFPYGEGGIERWQCVLVDFGDHVRWLLRYNDKRFRRHETFPFVCFGILQRRQVLGSARVQMQRQTFQRDARLLSTITVESMQRAQAEEASNLPISDPAIRLLRQHLYSTAGRVIGTDQSRYHLWITINPCDLHDPIAQVFAGEQINMDNFVSMLGPNKETRAHNIAGDPYAAAKFFHFMIKTIVETLFGVHVTPHQVYQRKGIFGFVSAYFGVVESQGRGSLHLHILLWLNNVPTMQEMESLLTQTDFRDRAPTFIKANIRAYLPGLESADAIRRIPNEVDVAYSWPPTPASANYDLQLSELERRVVRAKQLHTCEARRCLIPSKNGQLICKRRVLFPVAEEDFIRETGEWGMKRLHAYLNAWVPALSINARCNNDVKLLTNSRATTNLTFYITSYQTKKQGKHHNLSAILAKGLAYHTANTAYVDDLRNQQWLLLFRLVHTINREQELAAPMVMSYLMGWGDTYRSHHYTPIYWTSFVSALFAVYGDLKADVGDHQA